MAGLEGTHLGDYDLLERIGSGGMAEVYRARQPRAFDREVAVKVIRPGFSEDPMFRARFLREGQAIAKLSHPNILQLIECDEQNGILYLVMPLARGGTLKDLIQQHHGPMPLSEAVPLFAQLCDAVQCAHDQDIIHRDIKPPNVLLLNRNTVMLADFGIARDDAETRLTTTGAGMGTVEYMAPEQAIGDATARSDVYSLGIVLYQMLTGMVPYSGSTPMQIMMHHREKPLRDPRTLNPGLPAEVAAVIQTALAKDPRERFGSPKALATALAQAAGFGHPMGGRLPASQPELPETVRVSSRNLPGLSAGSGALVPPMQAPQSPGPLPPSPPAVSVETPPPTQPQTPRKPAPLLIGLILAAVIVLGGLGIGGYVLFPKPSPSSTDTPTPRSTSTVLYQDALTHDSGGWDCQATCMYMNTGYHLTTNASGGFLASYLNSHLFTASDLTIEVTGSMINGDQQNAALGMGFRVQGTTGSDGYFFVMTAQGSYSLYLLVGNQPTKLIQESIASAFRTGVGSQNDFKIVVTGSTFTLFVNGMQTAQVSDQHATFTQGILALLVNNSGTEAVFSHLSVTTP